MNDVPQRPTVNVHIDFARLESIAHRGVRRAVLFMGLGLNAAHREDLRDYQLHKLPILPGQTSLPIDFFPRDLPPEQVDKFKQEFAVWIAGCGLRELMEHYALFLDHIHKFALAVFQQHGKMAEVGDQAKLHQEFTRRLGVPDKLKALKSRFGVEPSDAESIAALYSARNCLAHDLGIVSAKRCKDGSALVLTWRAFDMLARGSGESVAVPLLDLLGKHLESDTEVIIRNTERRKSWKAGESLRLSQQDLWEICFFFNAHAIPTILMSFGEFLKAYGVPGLPSPPMNIDTS